MRGDGDEACQSRFRRQRVVVGAVEAAVGDAVADGEELPLAIEQEPELDLLDEVVGQFSETRRALDNLLSCGSTIGDSRASWIASRATFEGRRRSGAPAQSNQRATPPATRPVTPTPGSSIAAAHGASRSRSAFRCESPTLGALEPQRGLGRSPQIVRVRRTLSSISWSSTPSAALRAAIGRAAPVHPRAGPAADRGTRGVRTSSLRRDRPLARSASRRRVSDSSNSRSTSPMPSRDFSSMRGARTIAVDSPLLQCQQVAGQIAAVDGGDVRRRQRRQASSVVPVVEVPAISRAASAACQTWARADRPTLATLR